MAGFPNLALYSGMELRQMNVCKTETPMKFAPLLFILVNTMTAFASDSPDAREITDPKSIVSSADNGVVSLSVDDLFYTRSIDAGAWSPNGNQIVFITNLTGRNNLWKVSSDGGWPVQLSQSGDRVQTEDVSFPRYRHSRLEHARSPQPDTGKDRGSQVEQDHLESRRQTPLRHPSQSGGHGH